MVQRIGQRFPEPLIRVRFLFGAPLTADARRPPEYIPGRLHIGRVRKRSFIKTIFLEFLRLAGRGIVFFMHLLGQNAGSLPGKILLKISKDLPSYLTEGKQVILVTGTNGKTTVTAMLADIYRKCGQEVLTNESGANLIHGITSTLLESKRSKKDRRVLILEIDEAAFARDAANLNPQIILLNNLFDDQIDRLGNADRVLGLIKKGLAESKASHLVINGDDARLKTLLDLEGFELSVFRISKTELQASGHSKDIGPRELLYSPIYEGNNRYTMRFSTARKNGKVREVGFIDGLHNVANMAAALCLALEDGLSSLVAAEALEDYAPSFGRGQWLDVQGRKVFTMLVKNTAGLEMAMKSLSDLEGFGGILFAVNRRENDGRDISWFSIQDPPEVLLNSTCICTGEAGEHLSRTLLDLGLDQKNIFLIKKPEAAFDRGLELCEPGDKFFVFPNYSAMQDLKKHIRGVK